MVSGGLLWMSFTLINISDQCFDLHKLSLAFVALFCFVILDSLLELCTLRCRNIIY